MECFDEQVTVLAGCNELKKCAENENCLKIKLNTEQILVECEREQKFSKNGLYKIWLVSDTINGVTNCKLLTIRYFLNLGTMMIMVDEELNPENGVLRYGNPLGNRVCRTWSAAGGIG